MVVGRVSKLGPKLRGLALCAGFAVLFSCTPTMEEICLKRLPDLAVSLDNALTVLRDWSGESGGRRLASTDSPAPTLTDGDRRAWELWAEAHLVDAQKYSDQLSRDPKLKNVRDRLGNIANSFVSFHGYAAQSRFVPMIQTLENIQAESELVRKEVCRY